MLELFSNRELLQKWQEGEESAATILVNRYLVRLVSLARSRMSKGLIRRVDPEDIVLSAWKSFFIAVRQGRLTAPEADDLWPLLTTLTLRKIFREVEFQSASKRNCGRESGVFPDSLVKEVASREPSPDESMILEDEIHAILRSLDETAKEIFVRRLRGEPTRLIAFEMKISERTVRRSIGKIRDLIPGSHLDLHSESEVPVESSEMIPPHKSLLYGRNATILAEFGLLTKINYSDLHLEKLLGQGGFGKVFVADWKSGSRKVAVKYLKRKFWSDPHAVRSLLQEAQVLNELANPGYLTCIGVGIAPGSGVFLVTELLLNGSLDRWSREQNRSATDSVGMVLKIINHLHFAHQHGILHCDLKPSNVLLRTPQDPVLADFGFARKVGDLLAESTMGGTPGFLAPEQLSSAFGCLTVQTDVYGMGALLYALLSGTPPFSRDTPEEVLHAVVSHQLPVALCQVIPNFDKHLDEICLRCLAKHASDRFRNLDELKRALADWMKDVTTHAYETSED